MAQQDDLRAKIELFLELSGDEQLLAFNKNLDLTADKIKKVSVVSQKSNKKIQQSMVKTTAASQEMIRIVQDAPFGMMGITNNIQALFDNLAVQARRTGQSMTQVFGQSLKSIISGPMGFAALAAIISVVVLQWDKLAGMVDKAAFAFGKLSEKQMTINRLLRETKKILDDIKSGKAIVDAIEGLDTREDVINRLQEAGVGLENINEQMARFRKENKDNIELFEKLQNRQRSKVKLGFGFGEDVSQIAEDLGIGPEFEQFKRIQDRIDKEQTIIAAAKKRLLELGEDEIVVVGDKPTKERAEKIKDNEEFLTQLAIDAIDDEYAKRIAQIGFNNKKLLDKFEGTAEEERVARQRILAKTATEVNKEVRKQFKKEQAEREKQEQERLKEQKRLFRERTKVVENIAKGKQFGAQADFFSAMATAQTAKERIQIQKDFAQDQIDIEIARLRSLMALLGTETDAYKTHNQNIKALLAQRKAIEKQAGEDIENINLQTLNNIASIIGQGISNVGDTFGNMSTIFAKETEKGLEEQKGFLKAQAVMQAIAAGANITAQILSSPTLMNASPIAKIGYAFAAGSAVTTQLLATIRKINTSDSSGSTGSIGGGFTSLNSFITSDRVANLQEQNANRGHRRSSMRERERVKIVYDDKTAADIARKGLNYDNKTTRN